MTSSMVRKPNYARRIIWLLIAVVAVIGLYSAAWHVAAQRLEQEVNAAIGTLNGNGRRASCENAEARGYPFRIGIFCRTVLYEDAGRGVALRARAFRSAAQVYNPFHVIGELDGQATLQVPGLNALDLDWTSLRASARLARPLPERVSLEASDLSVRLDEAGAVTPPIGTAELLELHFRPAGADADLAARFAGLRIAPDVAGAASLPVLQGLADLSIIDGAARPAVGGLRGRAATLRSATVSIDDDTGVTVTGPISVGDDGLVDADLRVTVRNAARIGEILADLLPQMRQEIELSVSGLSAMGDTPTLPLRIVKGEVTLGFLALGSVPPL